MSSMLLDRIFCLMVCILSMKNWLNSFASDAGDVVGGRGRSLSLPNRLLHSS